jgi:hypothetical protein
MELKEEISQIQDKHIYGPEFEVDDISDPAANFPPNMNQRYQLTCYENMCVCCGKLCIAQLTCFNVFTCCMCSRCCNFTHYLSTSHGTVHNFIQSAL